VSDILREYLIALGWKVDDASYKKFKSSVANSAKEVAGLGSVTIATATAIGLSVEKVAREFEGLYYASQRTGETVNRLKSYSFAAKQIGIAYDQSAAALDSFTTAQRLNPGIKGFVGLGGGTGNGPVEQLTNFVEHQKKLYGEAGYYVAAMNAELAGIPEATFLQIWNNLPKLRAANAEMSRMRSEAGLSGRKFTDDSVAFTNAWDHLLGALDLGKERIASDLIGPVTQGIKTIDEVVQAFNRADVATNGWAGAIVGVTSALGGTAAALAVILRLLGLGGLVGAGMRGAGGLLAGGLGIAASPALAGAAAFYYGMGFNGSTAGKEDDEPLSKEYRAKHGGGSKGDLRQATIDSFVQQGWSRAAATGIASNLGSESNFDHTAVGDGGNAFGIGQWHKDRQDAFKAWSGKDIRGSTLQEQLAFVQYELTQGSDAGARRAGDKLRNTNDPYDAGVIFSGLYERPADVFGQAHARGQQAANWYDVPLTAGAGGSNVSITQKTDIHLPTSDPHAAGAAVAGAQDRVNGDLVRNFQGMTR
jgi:hypothetical protein